MYKPPYRFTDYDLYEEFLDPDMGISAGRCVAVKKLSQHKTNGIICITLIGEQPDGAIGEQSASLDYICDYCRLATYKYARDVTPGIFNYLKTINATTEPIRGYQTQRSTKY